jgi:hypothetical protein
MRSLIHRNAGLIRDLHSRIHQSFKEKSIDETHYLLWKKACADFHSKYDSLAFPGGYENAIQKISDGDSATIETALIFIEERPYFFRSQYMRTKLIRLLKRCDLNEDQMKRLLKSTSSQNTAEQGAAANP